MVGAAIELVLITLRYIEALQDFAGFTEKSVALGHELRVLCAGWAPSNLSLFAKCFELPGSNR